MEPEIPVSAAHLSKLLKTEGFTIASRGSREGLLVRRGDRIHATRVIAQGPPTQESHQVALSVAHRLLVNGYRVQCIRGEVKVWRPSSR